MSAKDKTGGGRMKTPLDRFADKLAALEIRFAEMEKQRQAALRAA